MLSILDLGGAVTSIHATHLLKYIHLFSILDDSDFVCTLSYFF